MDIPISDDPAPVTPPPPLVPLEPPRELLERHLWMQAHVAAINAGLDVTGAAEAADESRAEFAKRFYPEED
jgi:hypothetical protein